MKLQNRGLRILTEPETKNLQLGTSFRAKRKETPKIRRRIHLQPGTSFRLFGRNSQALPTKYMGLLTRAILTGWLDPHLTG